MHNKKVILIILLFLYLSPFTYSVFAQDSTYSHQSARVELGVGFGIVSEGSSFSGRLALSYLHLNWGGVIRISALDGKKGIDSGSGWFHGAPIEKFYDNGILLSYVIKQGKSWQTIASAGVGSLYGKRLTDTKDDLEEFGRITGFAFELGIASAGSTFGWSLNIMGNINSESNLIGVYLSLTLGYQK